MKTLGIIPARFGSTRFEGKPLARIHGKPMIQCVWEQVSQSGLFDEIVVATDDPRIADAVAAFGGKAEMTSPLHRSGTERCGEIWKTRENQPSETRAEVIVNIQGDEPQIQKEQLAALLESFQNPAVEIATLVKRITDPHEIHSPHVVKCVSNKDGRAMYFSRCPIPFVRENNAEAIHYKHIGVYAYRSSILSPLVALSPCPIEGAESLEQLRWLYNNFAIYVRETTFESISIDTPEDLENINRKTEKP